MTASYLARFQAFDLMLEHAEIGPLLLQSSTVRPVWLKRGGSGEEGAHARIGPFLPLSLTVRGGGREGGGGGLG